MGIVGTPLSDPIGGSVPIPASRRLPSLDSLQLGAGRLAAVLKDPQMDPGAVLVLTDRAIRTCARQGRRSPPLTIYIVSAAEPSTRSRLPMLPR